MKYIVKQVIKTALLHSLNLQSMMSCFMLEVGTHTVLPSVLIDMFYIISPEYTKSHSGILIYLCKILIKTLGILFLKLSKVTKVTN